MALCTFESFDTGISLEMLALETRAPEIDQTTQGLTRFGGAPSGERTSDISERLQNVVRFKNQLASLQSPLTL